MPTWQKVINMVDYGEAIKRPFSDVKKLLIGIVIQLIPIVNFMALGYQLRCAKTAMEKKFELPEWEDWGNLFVKGLMAVVIGFIYAIPAIIVSLIAMISIVKAVLQAVSTSATTGASVDPMMILSSVGITGILIFILGLLTSYIVPSALLSFVKNDSFGAAFRFGEIFKKAFTVKYLVVWIVVSLYSIVLTLVLALILSVIPLFGTFLGIAIAMFVANVTVMTALGEVYSEL